MYKIIVCCSLLTALVLPIGFCAKPAVKGVEKQETLFSDDVVLIACVLKNVCKYSDTQRIKNEIICFYKERYPDKELIVSFDLEVYARVKGYKNGVNDDVNQIIISAKSKSG